MSDDEEVMHSEEEEGAEDTGPSEAELAMKKRRSPFKAPPSELDEQTLEIIEEARRARAREEEEIRLLRQKREQRRKEREQEEKRLAQQRIEEDQRRKAEEEERKRKKEEEERKKKEARAAKMAEFEKWKNPPTPNFVITKKAREDGTVDEEAPEEENKKTKEQLEAEKQATLKQRITPLEISGFDASRLTEKAKELHNQIYRLESERYDLERRFKAQQYDMMELAERARSMNKVGKEDRLKRVQLTDEESDKIQERFAGCPLKILMYNPYDRQTDHRTFTNRRELYVGPVHGFPADKIPAKRVIGWNEEGQPFYVGMEEGGICQSQQEPQPEPVQTAIPAK